MLLNLHSILCTIICLFVLFALTICLFLNLPPHITVGYVDFNINIDPAVCDINIFIHSDPMIMIVRKTEYLEILEHEVCVY